MRHLNKIFGIGLATLSVSPALAGISMTNNVTTTSALNSQINEPEEVQRHYACTIAYLGKNCTANKQAVIARATDCSPKAVHLKLKHFKRDEIAGKTLEGKLGLKYTMPAHTYAYTSCPLSDKTSDNPVWASGMWENNGINEMGVCTTATLTCASNPKVLALQDESFITEGVGEELLPAIMTAQAATAKEAMQVAAKAIDDYGAQDANIIMASDQNEAWLMEIYSRHQYCAVKMPDDKVMIAGNEFILDSLNDLGINESNKDDLCITSKGLFDVVKNNPDIVRYRPGTTESQKDIFHLDLFNTYAEEGDSSKDGKVQFDDICHMRTWRGYSMYNQYQPDFFNYSPTEKYAPFLTPKDANGSIRTDMSAYDVMEVYRDEFDDNVNDPTSPRYDAYIAKAKADGSIRPIAVQTTRQVHIMSSDSTKPAWMAANEWYCPSSANYTPYVQINNAIDSYDGEYGYYPDRFNLDENCSSVLFRELNKLAWYDRKNYGYPLQDFWRVFEYIYITQMQQVIEDVTKLSQNDATTILTNFNKHVRDIIISQVKKTKKDLMWHIMDQPSKRPTFIPLIDLEEYVKELGWENYHFDGSTVTFERKAIKCTYKVSDGAIYATGKLTTDNGRGADLRDSVVDNKVYVDMAGLNSVIADYSEIKTININDYLNKFNHLVWIIPTVCAVVIGAGLATFFIIRSKKNHNKKAKR